MAREWSTADHFAAVLAELNQAKDDYDTNDPLRFSTMMMVRAADKALLEGITTARDILASIKQLRKEVAEAAAVPTESN